MAHCGVAPNFSTYYTQSYLNRSANGEDQVLYERLFQRAIFFNQQQLPYLDNSTSSSSPPPPPTTNTANNSFTYLEIGAFNGRQESNTRFYDMCLGWKGLLVEANPSREVWNKLVENRPSAHRMHFAASCPHDSASTATMPFYNVIWTNAAQAINTTNAYSNTTKEIVNMPCGSLTPFIQELLGGRVTFMSLDVEGAEPYILQQMDFNQVFIDVMIIENRNSFCGSTCTSRDIFRNLMTQAGYIRPLDHQFVRKSDLWLHPQSPFLKLLPGWEGWEGRVVNGSLQEE